jgi:hypothetical protein
MSEWQPIETVPKDGTAVLIYCPTENCIVSSRWRQDGDDGRWYGTDPMGRLNWIQLPTHWMPLPAPPGHGWTSDAVEFDNGAKAQKPQEIS